MSIASGRGWARVLGLVVVVSGALGAVAVFVPPPTGETTGARLCSPKNRLGYVSKEPCETCVSGEGCFNAIPMIERAQTRAASGDLEGAIAKMEEAVRVINSHRLGRVQRWDNLAELYCLRAAEEPDQARAVALRRDGLAMIAEFRCGVRIQQRLSTCALANADGELGTPSAWGFVPNPALTPLCYEAVCERGFQNDGEQEFTDPDAATARADWESHYEEMDDIAEDAANLGEIEQLCRRGLAP
jgi:hypothetical protein